MARDIFHPIVREALEKEGWKITHDPYRVRVKGQPFEINLGAEQMFAAQKGVEKIGTAHIVYDELILPIFKAFLD